MKQRVMNTIKITVATIIGVSYSLILLVTFLIATQAILDILDWARTELRGINEHK